MRVISTVLRSFVVQRRVSLVLLTSYSSDSKLFKSDPTFRTIIPIEQRFVHQGNNDAKTKMDRVGYPALTHEDSLFFVGSCFGTNMSSRFQQGKFNVLSNPFGVVYGSSAIQRSLKRIASEKIYEEEDLLHYTPNGCDDDGLWISLDHHSQFNNRNLEDCLNEINSSLLDANIFLKTCTQAYVTLGSAFVFDFIDPPSLSSSKTPGYYPAVANCHKLPSSSFSPRKLQKIEDIVSDLVSCVRSLRSINPKIFVTFTVSPVRHWKDGPVQNSRSKAHLVAAVHSALEEEEMLNASLVDYFPSYEIVMDELRDYRFYDEQDMLHPSGAACDYVLDRLLWKQFDYDKVQNVMKKVKKVKNALNHRPFHPDGKEYRKFLTKTLENIDRLEKEHPKLDFSSERQEVVDRVKILPPA